MTRFLACLVAAAVLAGCGLAATPERSNAALLLEGIVLRLQADLRWLEACEKNWASQRSGS